MIADMLSPSNVRTLHLDLRDFEAEGTTITGFLSGNTRCHALVGLFSAAKLRGISFANLLLLASRTPDFPSGHRQSLHQSFHYRQKIFTEDNS